MEQNMLFLKYQSGFRDNSHRQIEDGSREKQQNIGNFLNFKRALKTIDRELLLRELYIYGIQGKEFGLFEAYFTKTWK